MSRGSTPRHTQMAKDLGLAVQSWNYVAFCTAPLSSGQIVPRVTIGRVTPFIPRERPNGKHSIAYHLGLPWPTPAPALMQELHWHRCFTTAAICGSYTNAAYVQWIVWMDYAYYYAQDHSVLIFNCTPNIMFTVLCHANVAAYVHTCILTCTFL